MANCLKKIFKSLVNAGNPKDAITAEWSIYANIIKDLEPSYLGNSRNSESSVLHIGLFDEGFVTAFAETIASGTFVTNLQSEILKELGVHFADIKVYTTEEGYPQQRKKITGCENCYYTILSRTEPISTTKAQLSIVHNRGKLLQDSYVISPTDNVKRWNIGRGENVEGTYFRQNNIVFEDDSTNECNKYVSREHAHIVFSEGIGFLLYVDAGGRKSSGNRTRVFRDNNYLDLGSNMNTPIQLCDGDHIELGKHAILEFKMV